MIVLINGPFGVGKTTAAHHVVQRLEDSMFYDPENIGSFLRYLLGPKAEEDDYQDLSLWRHLTADIARRIHNEYETDLVIPMCIWRHDYFTEITTGLQERNAQLFCFRLTCSEETLRGRILGRPDAEGGHEWCLRRLDAGLAAARDSRFGTEISTEGRAPSTIANEIVASIRE